MSDPVFFTPTAPTSLAALAELVGCKELKGSGACVIKDVSSVDLAGEGDITFLTNRKYAGQLAESKASACILAEKDRGHAPENMALLLCDNPHVAYAEIMRAFYPNPELTPSIAASAMIAESANIGAGCQIDAGAIIGDNVTIGAQCHIGAHAVIERACTIGDRTIIKPLTTIAYAKIGSGVVIDTGARIGQEGFGFATDQGRHIRIPQIGRVIIGDNVHIGANTTIDRGAGPDTIIGDGCMIDNLVQIGHNVRLGSGCVIVSQAGVAGSTTLGNYVVCGGQVGIAGHLTIGDGAQIAGQAGVSKNMKAREVVGGTPAVPLRQYHKQAIALKKLTIHKKK